MIRSRLAAAAVGVLAAGTVLAIAAPAMALSPLPPDCTVAHAAATPPPQYTAPCTPTVTGTNPIPSGGGSVTLMVPGVASIVINVDNAGNVTVPTITPAAPFVQGTLTVNNTTGLVSITFTNKGAAGVVKPETYVIKAKVSRLPGAAGFAVQTIAKPVTHHKDDHGKGDDREGDDDSQGGPGGGQGWSGGAGPASFTGGHGHGGGGGD
jgi:uncharacterized membrane protein YgcG